MPGSLRSTRLSTACSTASRLNVVSERSAECPYCGEPISLLIDESVSQQDYIEDCQVCCRPMRIAVLVDADGDVNVHVADENAT